MQRRLGRSGITVGAVGLGTWAVGGPYWSQSGEPNGWGAVDDEESVRAIRRGIELGATLIDTAACYGCGHSERVVGRAVEGVRDEVVIATKFWHTFDEERKTSLGSLGSPDEIERACDESLARLGTDRIDLYQFHQGNCPAEEAGPVRDVCERLVEKGKIRWYGWSTDDPERARVFAAGEHCTAVQQRLNIFEGNLDMLALCEEADLASLNRTPLFKGLLSGKFTHASTFPEDDIRQRWWNIRDGREGEVLDRFEKLRDVMTSDGRTLAQAAIGWLWAKSERTVPIPGFKTVAQVEENCRAMEHGPLGKEQMCEIERLLTA